MYFRWCAGDDGDVVGVGKRRHHTIGSVGKTLGVKAGYGRANAIGNALGDVLRVASINANHDHRLGRKGVLALVQRY
ncbi:hypothetical protein D3C71_2088750 [compost metagenome]